MRKRCCCGANPGNDDYNSGRACCADCTHTFPWPYATYRIQVAGEFVPPFVSYQYEPQNGCGDSADCQPEKSTGWCGKRCGSDGGMFRKGWEGGLHYGGTFDFEFPSSDYCGAFPAAPYQYSDTTDSNPCPLSSFHGGCGVEVQSCANRIEQCNPLVINYGVYYDISEILLDVATVRSTTCPGTDPLYDPPYCIQETWNIQARYRRRKSCDDLYLAEGDYAIVWHSAVASADSNCPPNSQISWPQRCGETIGGLPSVLTVERTS